jgi:hypothetical protein
MTPLRLFALAIALSFAAVHTLAPAFAQTRAAPAKPKKKAKARPPAAAPAPAATTAAPARPSGQRELGGGTATY